MAGPSHLPQWIHEGSLAPAAALCSVGMEQLRTNGQWHSLAADRARNKSCTGSSWARSSTASLEPHGTGCGSKRKAVVMRQVRGKAGKALPQAPSSHVACDILAPSSKWDTAGLDHQWNGQGRAKSVGGAHAFPNPPSNNCLSWTSYTSERAPVSNQPSTNHLNPQTSWQEPPRLQVKPCTETRSYMGHCCTSSEVPPARAQWLWPLGVWGHASPQDLCCPSTISFQLCFPPFGEQRAGLPSCS